MDVQISNIINNPILKTGALILLSLFFAKISDVIFSFFMKKVVFCMRGVDIFDFWILVPP